MSLPAPPMAAAAPPLVDPRPIPRAEGFSLVHGSSSDRWPAPSTARAPPPRRPPRAAHGHRRRPPPAPRRLQRSLAREKDSSQASSLPEEKLNIAILCTVFVYKAMNGLGMLASIWATVVLLGGFSTLVKETDFWYVTVIAFVQSIGILGGYEDPAHQFFIRAPDALTKHKKAVDGKQGINWRRHTGEVLPQQRQRRNKKGAASQEVRLWGTHECRSFLGTTITVALWSAQLAAVATCMYLSSRRLSQQDYVDPQNLGQDTHRNITRSLNIFYVLVLAQGIIFIALLMLIHPILNLIMTSVRRQYRLLGTSGRDILVRYKTDNYLAFIAGNVRTTMNMDLVTFATNLVVSDSVSDQLLGIWAIDYILRSAAEYRRLALMKLRASLNSEALGKLVNMLGLIRTEEEEDIRGHAARVVLRLAPDLPVESFPQILNYISLLFNTANKKMRGMDVDMVWFGLRILDKLVDSSDNCRQAEGADDLLSKIIDLAGLCDHGSTSYRSSVSWIEEEVIPSVLKEEDIPPSFKKMIDEETIVGMSLKVLSKLLGAPGKAGEDLRRKTSESENFLINSGMILAHVEATRVIACLALNDTARKEIGRSTEIIRKLKDCLLLEIPHIIITEVAAKLFLLECAGGEQLSQIQSFIAEKRILEDQIFFPPVSAVVQELDLESLLSLPWVQDVIQTLDLEDILSAPRVNHSEAAAEALVLLTTDCRDNINAAVLDEINPKELKMLVKMLCAEDGENRSKMVASLQGRNLNPEMSRIVIKIACGGDGENKRSMAAKLLQNLRAYSGQKCFDQHMQVIDEALPKVLKSIVDEVTKLEDPASTSENMANINDELRIKEGKLLESFIGLAVQTCASKNASDFTRALEGAELTEISFVPKLKKILEVYKSPTTEIPGIRRSTVELMTWMVRINSNYVELFLQCGLYEQLNEVANTARKLENFKLYHCGVGVAEHSTSISSLAKKLQAQLALSPNFQERTHCYGEHAGTITVLVA